MLSVRQIRRKIRTVRNIHKITDAMKRVAAAKLRRAQDRVAAARPYAEKLAEIMMRVGGHAGEIEHPLLEVRPAENVVLVVVGSDRGLCGSYNGNLCRRAQRFIEECPHPVKLVTVNKKADAFFRHRQAPILRTFRELSGDSTAVQVAELSSYLRDLYAQGEADEVYVCYNEFVSAVLQQPTIQKFLPFAHEAEPALDVPAGDEGMPRAETEYIFEPDARAILLELIPAYVDTQVFHVILEATASEHGARMCAMTNATDNAAEMLADLTLTYNKARQAGITTELLEIVSGAEALTER